MIGSVTRWSVVAVLVCGVGRAQEALWEAKDFAGLAVRNLGPAMMSGRIADIAIHPQRPSTWYVAAASGGVWKTTNRGTTWTPVFDDQGSYSIGCLALDPRNPDVIWVGTGENNSQRSVGYGDGIYRSDDGGASWKRVGLHDSEHISQIVVDPRDSRVVYVAAQGPLWKDGGDRGLFKTTNGGASFDKVLDIDEHTGVNEFTLDPRNPDIIVASTYQRRRHVWTLINGGPGSGVHRSEDGGVTWTRIRAGLPDVELGRIGLARSPSNPDIIYAIAEAQFEKGGVFRSVDGGRRFEKRSTHVSSSPQYYNELVVDPNNPDRVYSLDTFLRRSDDGGKTWHRYSEATKHVDNHALWIDSGCTDHLIAGCDGGIYESWDLGATWRFTANLPLTQFYRVTPDQDSPFYNVYGGTQDNATQGGPSRTRNRRGIRNDDWFVTVFGDGFKTQVDPTDPDTLYSQWQHGGLVRYDRKTGETLDIQPQAAPGEPALRWNWDSALIISPHAPQRLYFGAQRLFRSDDRGHSWTPVSGDLTRNLDRNTLPVMGRIWSVDAVAKNASTSFYGNIVALSESPRVEGTLYVGTDDGLVQVSRDGGATWTRTDQVAGVPESTYVNALVASLHVDGRVYGAFNNHKRGDFNPYVMRSDDYGVTWVPVIGDLPERGSVYALAEDHENPNLLFCGTEFGAFFTLDGGVHWLRLKGLPTIAVRDLEIQRRESDLVIATFGRGIGILDDYSPLRRMPQDREAVRAELFPVRRAWRYVEMADFDTVFQGDAQFVAKNPSFGALITYRLGEAIVGSRDARRKREQARSEKGEDNPYPSWEELRGEDEQEEPKVFLLIRDGDGNGVRKIPAATEAGLHRTAWDLRYHPSVPVRADEPELAPWDTGPRGALVPAGEYTVELLQRVDGVESVLAGPEAITVSDLPPRSLPTEESQRQQRFRVDVAETQRTLLGFDRLLSDTEARLGLVMRALDVTPTVTADDRGAVLAIQDALRDVRRALSGDATTAARNAPTPSALAERLSRIVGSVASTTSPATATHEDGLRLVQEGLREWTPRLDAIVTESLPELEAVLEKRGAPWTPGRVPRWR